MPLDLIWENSDNFRGNFREFEADTFDFDRFLDTPLFTVKDSPFSQLSCIQNDLIVESRSEPAKQAEVVESIDLDTINKNSESLQEDSIEEVSNISRIDTAMAINISNPAEELEAVKTFVSEDALLANFKCSVSDSNFEHSRVVRPKRILKRSTARIEIPIEEDLIVKKQRIAAKRSCFSRRAPFLYKSTCDCKTNHFSYISSAIKHVIDYHGFEGPDFNNLIECIDDFDVIGCYQYKCDYCPFRANKQSYIDLHIINHVQEK